MTPPAFQETDMDIKERKLRERVPHFSEMTSGELSDFMYQMRCLPKERRHRLWIATGRELPSASMKYFKKWYTALIGPDRRPKA